jgi:hypothetical protein
LLDNGERRLSYSLYALFVSRTVSNKPDLDHNDGRQERFDNIKDKNKDGA